MHDSTPRLARLTEAMIGYYGGDPRRVQHFLAVYGYAKAMAELEGLDGTMREIIEAAALTHDIGIKASIEKHGSYTASTQEEEGPPMARPMLESLGFGPELVERVCYLIGHHHTYNAIDGVDYQILVEADFLVNIHGHSMEPDAIAKIKRNIFRTAAGIRFLEKLYSV